MWMAYFMFIENIFFLCELVKMDYNYAVEIEDEPEMTSSSLVRENERGNFRNMADPVALLLTFIISV